jgi:hypothetical protein
LLNQGDMMGSKRQKKRSSAVVKLRDVIPADIVSALAVVAGGSSKQTRSTIRAVGQQALPCAVDVYRCLCCKLLSTLHACKAGQAGNIAPSCVPAYVLALGSQLCTL